MKKFLIGILLLLVCCILIPSTYAWLTLQTSIQLPLSGSVFTAYFHCGDGSENNPYVITRPVHLYNLTMLYQKLNGFDEESIYVQIGYDLDNNGTLELYNYDDNGNLLDGYTNILNMNSQTGFVPIGTESHPFKAIFNGNNFIVNNLTIIGQDEADVGIFGYTTEDSNITNLYFNNLKIDISNCSGNSYVGYISGYVEDATCFENVYINDCELYGTASNFQSDWGYFGYCQNAASLDEFIMRAKGENAGWGGSVNMQKMYDRLYAIAGQATTNNNYAFEKDIVTKVDNSTFERNALTGYAYTYKSQLEGSFVFTRYNAQNGPRSNYMYLNGGTRYYQYIERETQVTTGQKISYNGHYFGVSGTSIADHNDTWEWENNYLAIYINGTKYYLTHDLTLSTTTQETWTKNGSRFYYTTSSWFTTTYHYLTYNNDWTIATATRQNNCTQLTWANGTYIKISEVSNGSDYMDYTGSNVTYFPLVTNSNDYTVARKNTGYVIGGSEDNTTSAYPDKTGDIRVSKYSTSDISSSYSGGSLTNVYTISSNLTSQKINISDYSKYLDSRDEFLESITNGNIYGLHFMPANININHLVNADYVLINGEEYYNYVMPASSIDFNVMEKGYINFFAGTYFSGNDSFFSLHHIERNEQQEIISIKEIAEIYKSSDESKPYIYKYTDNSTTETITSDYSLVFSTNRIKKQRSGVITTNAVYYFEIPVNEGEYALGSVDGGTGAYLMYLDIATNGGIDQQQNVDTFGSVEYRTNPNTAENSILLLTYKQEEEIEFNIKVNFTNNTYNITTTKNIPILVTKLNEEYFYKFNNEQLSSDIESINKI